MESTLFFDIAKIFFFGTTPANKKVAFSIAYVEMDLLRAAYLKIIEKIRVIEIGIFIHYFEMRMLK